MMKPAARKPNINVLLRKYHKQISIVTLFPMTLLAITGTIIPIVDNMGLADATNFMIKLHTGKLFGLDTFYSIACGLALIGLLVTGVALTGLLPKSRAKSAISNGVED